MSAFRACVRSESAGQCPWVIAKRAPQMPGGQGVAGSNPVHPTRIFAGQRVVPLTFYFTFYALVAEKWQRRCGMTAR